MQWGLYPNRIKKLGMARIQLPSRISVSAPTTRTEASLPFIHKALTIPVPRSNEPESKAGSDQMGMGPAAMPERVVRFAVVTGRSRRSGAGDRKQHQCSHGRSQ